MATATLSQATATAQLLKNFISKNQRTGLPGSGMPEASSFRATLGDQARRNDTASPQASAPNHSSRSAQSTGNNQAVAGIQPSTATAGPQNASSRVDQERSAINKQSSERPAPADANRPRTSTEKDASPDKPADKTAASGEAANTDGNNSSSPPEVKQEEDAVPEKPSINRPPKNLAPPIMNVDPILLDEEPVLDLEDALPNWAADSETEIAKSEESSEGASGIRNADETTELPPAAGFVPQANLTTPLMQQVQVHIDQIPQEQTGEEQQANPLAKLTQGLVEVDADKHTDISGKLAQAKQPAVSVQQQAEALAKTQVAATAEVKSSFATTLAGQMPIEQKIESRQEQIKQTTAAVTRSEVLAQPAQRGWHDLKQTEPGRPVALLHQPFGSEGWDRAMGQKLIFMLDHQQQEVEMQLNPPHLGPIDVTLSLDKDKASLSFYAQHAPVREALQASMPKLGEMLAESGIHLAEANVQSRGQGDAQREQASGQRRSTTRRPENEELTSLAAGAALRGRMAKLLPGGVNLFV